MAKKKKAGRKWWIIGISALVLLLIAGAIYKAKTRPKGIEVTFKEVKKRKIVEKVSASGKVFPEKEVKISSDVSGEIVKLFIQEGDSVKAGQVLIKIDPDTYLSSVERGRASLNDAKSQKSAAESNVQNSRAQKEQLMAQLDNAKRIHDRNTALYNDGVISRAEFESSETSLNQLKANIRAAEAAIQAAQKNAEGASYRVNSAAAGLRELQTSLSRTTITAPIDGVISKLNVEEGERVVGTIQMAGTEIMRLANMNNMEVQVEVSENDILRVEKGNEVEIEVDAFLDRKFKGKVTEIANSASGLTVGNTVVLTSDQVTNFVVKILMDIESYKDLINPNKPFPFRPGMTATVEILTKTVDGALSVPIQAVTTREPEKEDDDEEVEDNEILEVVFIKMGDTVAMREVETGPQDDEYIQILNGLEEGEVIVSGPYSAVSKKLESGDKVHKKEKKKEKRKWEED